MSLANDGDLSVWKRRLRPVPFARSPSVFSPSGYRRDSWEPAIVLGSPPTRENKYIRPDSSWDTHRLLLLLSFRMLTREKECKSSGKDLYAESYFSEYIMLKCFPDNMIKSINL